MNFAVNAGVDVADKQLYLRSFIKLACKIEREADAFYRVHHQ